MARVTAAAGVPAMATVEVAVADEFVVASCCSLAAS